ncbi:MAG: translocase [Oscillochloris sp.]|nr:translocase [Oscillochloris sp.]
MEIFNVSIPELILIAGLALVVFGPERLPEIGRLLGKQVAKLLAWQQNSPELQMLNEVRSEFETEIASLRDELVRTRKQLDVTKDISALKEELRPMLDLRGGINGITQAASGQATATTIAPPVAAAPTPPPATGAGVTPPPPEAGVVGEPRAAPAIRSIPATGRPTKVVASEPTSVLGTPIPIVPNNTQLAERIQQLSADLQTLTAELQARGHLGTDWPSPAQKPEQEGVAP